MNDYELLESIKIPPAYASRLAGSNLKHILAKEEQKYEQLRKTLEEPKNNKTDPKGPESLEPGTDGTTEKTLHTEIQRRTPKDNKENQLTPLEKALMDRFGTKEDR